MRKNILIFLLLICIVMSSCSCTGVVNNNDKLNIITSNFPLYDIVRQICGDKANITMLTPVGAELHSYEPTPKDILNINQADLFIYMGGSSESFISDILNSTNSDHLTKVSISDMTEFDLSYDEHIWTSPYNVIKMTSYITEAIIDKDNQKEYKENAQKFISELTELDEKFFKLVENSKRDTIVFADKYPIKYFSERYNLNYYSVYSSCAHESEPDIADVKNIIDIVKEKDIPAVFCLEFSNEKLVDAIVSETNTKKLKFNSCHNVSKDELLNGVSYLTLMEDNYNALGEALN